MFRDEASAVCPVGVPTNLYLAPFQFGLTFYLSIPWLTGQSYQQFGAALSPHEQEARESFNSQHCGVVPAAATRAAKHRNTNQMTACKRRQKRKTIMTASRKSIFISMFAALLSLGVFVTETSRSPITPPGDFSLAGNPNGVWSYGWSTTLGSAFNLDSSQHERHIQASVASTVG